MQDIESIVKIPNAANWIRIISYKLIRIKSVVDIHKLVNKICSFIHLDSTKIILDSAKNYLVCI